MLAVCNRLLSNFFPYNPFGTSTKTTNMKSASYTSIWICLMLNIFFSSGSDAFSSSIPVRISGHRQRRAIKCLSWRLPQEQQICPPAQRQQQRRNILQQTSSNDGISAAEALPSPRSVPKFVYKLNASTKWLITLACTIGVWARVHRYEGPFVIIGSIMSVYFTEVLKRIVNQSRPDGAPFADPGMPSSHSLVSFFLAVAWSTLAFPSSPVVSGSLLICAGFVALLRVICGYHSWAQIAVGSILGCSMGFSWAKLGSSVATHGHPTAVFRASWIVYLVGSVFYAFKTMRPWLYEEKHL